jgi:hypothetical protein
MPRYEYNSGEHIDDIISRTICDRHNGDIGVACFYVFYGTKHGEVGPAVCNNRVKAAGFNGEIKPSSLQQKSRPKGSYFRR